MVLSQSLGYLWLKAIRPGFSNFSRETFQITRTKVSAKLEIDIDILSIFYRYLIYSLGPNSILRSYFFKPTGSLSGSLMVEDN